MAWNTAYQMPRSPISGQNREASSNAPAPSSSSMAARMNRVRRTMPPTWGAEMDSCITHRSFRPIRRPASMEMATATVTTPMPPIWISTMMTAWPKPDQY